MTDDSVSYLSYYHYLQACTAKNLFDEEYHIHGTFNRGCAKYLTFESFQSQMRNHIYLSNETDTKPSDMVISEDVTEKTSFLLKDLLKGLTTNQTFILAWLVIKCDIYGDIESDINRLLKDFKPFLKVIFDRKILTRESLKSFLGINKHKFAKELSFIMKKTHKILNPRFTKI